MISYITYAQLAVDVQKLLKKLPYSLVKNLAGVLGIPRSGMLPATMVANHLHLPLCDTVSFYSRGEFPSAGKRLTSTINQVDNGDILVVDDSVYTGNSMNYHMGQLNCYIPHNFITCAIYRCPEKQAPVDYYAVDVPKPRYFEWNLMQHPDLATTMLDMDGVLCYDPTVWDDDGRQYVESLVNAVPYHLPRHPVESICTMRLDKHRAVTTEWLARHDIQYQSLHMVDVDSAEQRRKHINYGKWKGDQYRMSDAQLFIESSAEQCEAIAAISKKPVICLQNHRVYQEESI